MKPLYLNGRTGMSVALDEPALRVNAPGRAITLYPLQRISRVVASGPVEWSTAALLACAERGITVTFLHPDGAMRAYLFGETDQRQDVLHRLRDLLDRPDWQDRYADWYRGMESRARLALIRKLQIDIQGAPSPRQLEMLLAETKQRFVSPTVRRFIDRRLQGLLQALTAELLAEAGLNAYRARCIGGRLDLAQDLVRLLAWDLHLPVLEWLSRPPTDRESGPRIDDTELVRLFEGRSEGLRRLARTILNRFHGWLVETVP